MTQPSGTTGQMRHTQSGLWAIVLHLQNYNNVNQGPKSITVTALSIVDSQGHVVQTLNSFFPFTSKCSSGDERRRHNAPLAGGDRRRA